MEEFYAFVRSAWVVWMMALFIGMLVWVLWPSNREKFRKAADIPLADDDRRQGDRNGRTFQQDPK